MADISIKVIMGAILFLCGVQDALKKKIFLWIVALGFVSISAFIPFCSNVSILDRIGGMIVGIIIIIVSVATAGKIGIGDGLLLCVTGLGLGFWGNLELFGMALLLASIVSIYLLIRKLANRKKSIPFIPFLLISYVFLILADR